MATVNNPWLRGVKGKVAGMVVQGGTTRGTTIIRERVDPVDPDTTLQRVQRVIMATAGVAYSKMSDIVDHSFEGYNGKAANMNRFRSLNANMLRQFVASKQAAGVDWGRTYDFTPRGTQWLGTNPYIMSEGSLPRIPFEFDEAVLIPTGLNASAYSEGEDINYVDLINGLSQFGMKLGDQITVCAFHCGKRVSAGGGNYGGIEYNPGFGYCRFILKGNQSNVGNIAFQVDGDGEQVTGASLYTPGMNQLTQLNGWSLKLTIIGGKFYMRFDGPLDGNWDKGLAAACAILSRKVNDKWLRSPSTMIVDQPTDAELQEMQMFSLSTAISKTVSNISAENDLYLNNAQD